MKRVFAIGIPLLLLLGLVGWRLNAKQAAAGQMQAQQRSRGGQAPVVEIAVAESRPILESIEVVGTVEAPYVVKLSPRISGRIDFLDVREGDRVQPGQQLVRIDPSELDAQILQQQAQVSEARSRLLQAEMTSGANETGVHSSIRVQSAAVESAKAELNRAQKNFDSEVSAAESAVDDAHARVNSADADVRREKAELTAAQVALKNAKSRLERLENLLKKGFVAEQQVDDALERVASEEASVGVAQSQVASAQSGVESAKAQKSAAEKRLAVAKESGQAGIATAKARLEQAKAAYDEAVANKSQAPAYRESLKALRAGVQAAEAGLEQLRTRRSDLTLASPIEGTVTERHADPGTLASPGQAVVTIQFLKWVFVTAGVPVEHAAKVYPGQAVKIRFDAFEGREFEGKIEKINPSADPQSRQFTVKVRLENPKEELKPGMFAKLDVVTRIAHPPVVVPITAVTTTPAGSSVIVLDEEDKAAKRRIETGISDRQGIAVEKGLEPGDRVITLSYSPVREGQKVRVEGPRDQGTQGPRDPGSEDQRVRGSEGERDPGTKGPGDRGNEGIEGNRKRPTSPRNTATPQDRNTGVPQSKIQNRKSKMGGTP